jgi:hypothetical protein
VSSAAKLKLALVLSVVASGASVIVTTGGVRSPISQL